MAIYATGSDGKRHLVAGGGGKEASGPNVAGYVGEIVYFADSILRPNHVWADGGAINAGQWPELAEHAAAAGWTQNEAGQYLTPDLRGRFLLGASDKYTVGTVGGEENHTLTVQEMPSHFHKMNLNEDSSSSFGFYDPNKPSTLTSGPAFAYEYGMVSNRVDLYCHTGNSGGSKPHNNMPPYYTVTPQIRAKVDVVYTKAVIACPYDVGDILQTENPTPPAERWPGTEWEELTGRFLLGHNDDRTVGSEGGEETHTLTVEEMPSHAHPIMVNSIGEGPIFGPIGVSPMQGDITTETMRMGNSQPHNNMPPYHVVYIWKRTG